LTGECAKSFLLGAFCLATALDVLAVCAFVRLYVLKFALRVTHGIKLGACTAPVCSSLDHQRALLFDILQVVGRPTERVNAKPYSRFSQ
jgi:hypothetical protein